MGALGWPRRAFAREWGTAPSDSSAALLLPQSARAHSVLEVYLSGGFGPFETFYVVPEHGRPDDAEHPDQQWHCFADRHEEVFSQRCGLPEDQWLEPWVVDERGMQVFLGPALLPFRQRPDLLRRMRVLVHGHDLEPHDAAVPFALTGQRLGSPRMAALGAAVQRHVAETGGGAGPFSYVLKEFYKAPDNIEAADSTGLHPATARPLTLRIDQGIDGFAALARAHLGDRREAFDALIAHQVGRLRGRHRIGGLDLRARALDDHAFAVQALASAPQLAALFPPELVEAYPGEACSEFADFDAPGLGLDLAAHLLRHPTRAARHVQFIDQGLLRAVGGSGYDTHHDHLPDLTRNLSHTLQHLADRIAEPGDDNPALIQLDETMVVLNTEFGRAPFKTVAEPLGTEHWPYGYVTVLLGGPIGEDQAGLVGALGPDGRATGDVVDVRSARAAVLTAMGIWPFADEAFSIGDFADVDTEDDGVVFVQGQVLGRPQ